MPLTNMQKLLLMDRVSKIIPANQRMPYLTKIEQGIDPFAGWPVFGGQTPLAPPQPQQAPTLPRPTRPPPPRTGGIPPLIDLSHLRGRMPTAADIAEEQRRRQAKLGLQQQRRPQLTARQRVAPSPITRPRMLAPEAVTPARKHPARPAAPRAKGAVSPFLKRFPKGAAGGAKPRKR